MDEVGERRCRTSSKYLRMRYCAISGSGSTARICASASCLTAGKSVVDTARSSPRRTALRGRPSWSKLRGSARMLVQQLVSSMSGTLTYLYVATAVDWAAACSARRTGTRAPKVCSSRSATASSVSDCDAGSLCAVGAAGAGAAGWGRAEEGAPFGGGCGRGCACGKAWLDAEKRFEATLGDA